jgi:hypothetical protein
MCAGASTEQNENVARLAAHRAGELSFVAYLCMLLEGTVGR